MYTIVYVHADMAAIIFTIYEFNSIIQLFYIFCNYTQEFYCPYILEIYLD